MYQFYQAFLEDAHLRGEFILATSSQPERYAPPTAVHARLPGGVNATVSLALLTHVSHVSKSQRDMRTRSAYTSGDMLAVPVLISVPEATIT